MYYLQSRYYDPTTCRFINADAYASTGQGVLGYNMFAYCLNNAVSRKDPYGTSGAAVANVDDYDPIKDWLSSLSGGGGGTGAGGAVIVVGADVIGKVGFIGFLELLFGPIDFISDNSGSSEEAKTKEEKNKEGNGKKPTPPTPDVTFPGNDPLKAPDGYTWKGEGTQGSKDGNYFKKETGESLHPDLNHPEGIKPHWDYNYRGSGVKGWRIFEDGSIELKP